jgi:glycosyltransferase involved in cell wall biosynthesis
VVKPVIRLIYITRSDISWYSRNANAYQKPFLLSEAFDLTLICPAGTIVPEEIAAKCTVIRVECGDVRNSWSLWKVVRFMTGAWREILACGNNEHKDVATGFDIPCLMLGWLAKRRLGVRWIVFCWDPPALSWRDKRGVLARGVVAGVDRLFKWLVKDADRLVLNINPGVLNEMGVQPHEKQLIQMVNGFAPLVEGSGESCGSLDPWLIGVLSVATQAKGLNLTLDAFIVLAKDYPQLRIIWIGDVADDVREALLKRLSNEGISLDRFVLAGRMAQQDAFRSLKACGILLHPYLAVPSLKWNYPLKIVEYMSMDRAIVAGDTPGVRSYITDEANGLLFKAGDVEDLCSKLSRIVGNQAEQKRLGQQAKRDSQNFEWPRLNSDLESKLTEGLKHG